MQDALFVGGSKVADNVWCYEQVCLAEMFKFSTNVIGKLAYSTCYKLAAVIYRKTQIEALNKKN